MKTKPMLFIIFGLALFGAAGFYFFVAIPAQQRALAQQQQALTAQQQQLAAQQVKLNASATELASATAASEQSAEAARAERSKLEETQANMEDLRVAQTRMADVAAVAGGAKTALAEFAMTTGALCTSNKECGLSAPESYATGVVRSLRVSAKGVIVLDFKDGLSKVELLPQFDPQQPGPFRFSCRTNVARAGTWLAECSAL
jgi:flagellar hook protein FlgE